MKAKDVQSGVALRLSGTETPRRNEGIFLDRPDEQTGVWTGRINQSELHENMFVSDFFRREKCWSVGGGGFFRV